LKFRDSSTTCRLPRTRAIGVVVEGADECDAVAVVGRYGESDASGWIVTFLGSA